MNAAEYLAHRTRDVAQRARREQADAEQEARIIALLPAGIEFEQIMGTAYMADAFLSLQPVATVAAADLLMRLLPPLPLARVKGGTLSFKPFVQLTAYEREYGQVTDIAPFLLRHEVAPFYPSGQRRRVQWWTRVGAFLVAITLPLTDCVSTVTIHCSGHFSRHLSTAAHCRGAQHDSYWCSDPREQANIVFWWNLGPLSLGTVLDPGEPA